MLNYFFVISDTSISNVHIVKWIMLKIQIILQKFYKLLMWWVIIGKWKIDINGEPRWKSIKGWS